MALRDDYPFETRAVLVYGRAVEQTPSMALLEELNALMRGCEAPEPPLDYQLVLGADVEHAEEAELLRCPAVAGVVLREVTGEGDMEFGMSFEELRGRLSAAAGLLDVVDGRIQNLGRKHRASLTPPRLWLVPSGWLATAMLVKGQWYSDESEAEAAGDAEFHQGTDGASSEPYPEGGVLGIHVASDSFDGYGGIALEINEDIDAQLDGLLEDAGVDHGSYFVLCRYD